MFDLFNFGGLVKFISNKNSKRLKLMKIQFYHQLILNYNGNCPDELMVQPACFGGTDFAVTMLSLI